MTVHAKDGEPQRSRRSLPVLAIGALGIVFGDIGTSPLYTLQVGIAPEPGTHPRGATSSACFRSSSGPSPSS